MHISLIYRQTPKVLLPFLSFDIGYFLHKSFDLTTFTLKFLICTPYKFVSLYSIFVIHYMTNNLLLLIFRSR